MSETILMDGDPALRQRSKEVEHFGPELEALLGRMVGVLVQRPARGLAAIQIGVPLRVVIARVGQEVRYMVNPVITRTLKRDSVEREGCLSVLPRNWRSVARPAKCEIEWFDSRGVMHHEGFSGEWARILQHEIDHLDGVLITDKEPAA